MLFGNGALYPVCCSPHSPCGAQSAHWDLVLPPQPRLSVIFPVSADIWIEHRQALGVQKRTLEPLELEVQVVVSHLTWVLGAEFRSGPLQEQSVLLTSELTLALVSFDAVAEMFGKPLIYLSKAKAAL